MYPRSLGAKILVVCTLVLVAGAATLLWDVRGVTDGTHFMRVTGRSQFVSGGGRNGPPRMNWNIRFSLDDGRAYDYATPDGSRESSFLEVGTTWKAIVWKCRLRKAVCRISDAVEQQPDRAAAR